MNNAKEMANKGKCLIASIIAGNPSLHKTKDNILEMAKAGVDLIEIGIPFSDPIAADASLQEVSLKALSAGVTIDAIFILVKEVRQVSDIPLSLMTYINPMFKYGYNKFCKKCNELDIYNIIICDMPFSERGEIFDIATSYGINIINTIATKSQDIIEEIAKNSTGYLNISCFNYTEPKRLEQCINLIKMHTDIPIIASLNEDDLLQMSEHNRAFDGVALSSNIEDVIINQTTATDKKLYDYIKKVKSMIN